MTDRSPLPSESPEERRPAHDAGGSPAQSLTALVEAGLPLEAGLMALSEEAPTRQMRHVLRRMSRELAQGQPPDEVLARPGTGLPNYLRGLVRAGVQSGQLGAFLEQFLLSVRRRRDAARSFWAMMAYPLLLLPFVFLVGTAILGWIVPQFEDIFTDFGVELPTVTLFLLALASKPVLIGILVGVPALVLIVGVLIVVGRLVPGHAGRLRALQSIPVIGTPSRMRGMAEFCSLLGLLVSGRIPLPDALRMTASALHDGHLKQGAARLASRVEQGEPLESAAAGLPHFSRSQELLNLFRWAPRGEVFGDILLRAGEVFSSRSRVQAGLAMMLFQPIVFVVTALFIGFVVLALFMPLIKMLNELS